MADAAMNRRGLIQAAASALAVMFALPLGALRRMEAGEGWAIAPVVEAGALSSTSITTQPVSPTLMEIMCAHCAAYAELGRISKRTDTIVLGHTPSAVDLGHLEDVGQNVRNLFMQLCRYPAVNDVERQEKAAYLLTFCDGDEFEREHVEALLRSMGGNQLSGKVSHPDRPA